ncbi:retrotransposon protein, putative, ty1-copia subclass, partial [Tanacetum coccineum]
MRRVYFKKAATPQVMAIQGGRIQKANKKSLNAKRKGKMEGKGKDKNYALESAARILNMVPTKKVDKTPYELWIQSVLLFLLPHEKQIVVARYAKFLEKNLISQEVSGRAVELKEIQDEDTSPSEINNKIPMEVKGFEPPHEEEAPVRRDLNKPANYKATMLDPKSDKWPDAMNAEMHSMKDNQVCRLVDIPPSCKTIRSKWLFFKKTDMDGIVHTYKARLVAKRFYYLYGGDFEENVSFRS